MKKYILTLVIALFAFNSYAADLKIGYIDLNKALNESEPGKEAVQLLEDMVKAKQVEINEKGEKIKQIEEMLSKQASILTENSIKEQKDERERLFRDYQRMVKDSQEEVQKKQAEFMDNIVKDIRTIVLKIGKEEGYSLILEKAESGLLYYSPEIDMTESVIKQINETLKKPQ